MNIPKIKKGLFSQKKILNKNLGFTLVELIIVITILAILATVAFMSFKNYSWNARDGNRISTLKNIETGLELYFVKTWKYPMPEWNISTGTINDIWTQKENVYFITDSGKNIPYAVSGITNIETPNEVLARKTWKPNAQFENIDITEIVNAKTSEEKKAKIQEVLGSDPIVKQVILDSFWAESDNIFETIINGSTPNVGDNNNNGSNTPNSELS